MALRYADSLTVQMNPMQTTPLVSNSVPIVQAVLWGLMVASVLLTLRASASGTWLTMWFAALTSLGASLVAIWSIGSLIFLLTCFQLAAAVAMRWSVGWQGWLAFLLAGAGIFGFIIYGLAFMRAWDLWMIALPLIFAVTSLLLFANLQWRRE